mmetsp:Transcript_62035/g.102993  ORF Transcript_62035/g.102993 Transcript_62035/m.102993 type:complete len:433 (-) Transcript_62035:55-1353(-)
MKPMTISPKRSCSTSALPELPIALYVVLQITAPALPPAPTRPDTTPLLAASTNGTTPNVAPSALWTKALKVTSMMMANGRSLIWLKITIMPPVPAIVIISTRIRPAMPAVLAYLSERYPPIARANRFISPNREAISPAVAWVSTRHSFSSVLGLQSSFLNPLKRNITAALFTNSSIPKQQPYKITRTHVLRLRMAVLKMDPMLGFSPVATSMRFAHFPSGQSSENKYMVVPRIKKNTAGTCSAILQAALSVAPQALMIKKIRGMKACTKPPPRLPQPPAMALAVPTTLPLNRAMVQNWHGTNVAPARPTNNRSMISPVESCTTAPRATGMDVASRTKDIQRLGPSLSHMGPMITRARMVAMTAHVLASPICGFVKPSCFLTVGIRGAKANHPTNATKKPTVANQKPRMWGRLTLSTRISRALLRSSRGISFA